MINIKQLRQDPAHFKAQVLRRGDPSLGDTVDKILTLDQQRRRLLAEVEQLKADRNIASQEVARLKKGGAPADDLLATLKTASDRIKVLDNEVRECDAL